MRQTSVAALGLITRPNQYGAYPPGACSQATNVCFRAPGIVEGFNATAAALSAVATTGYSVKKIWTDGWADDTSILSASFKNGVVWKLSRGTTPITGLSGVPEFDTGFANGAFVRERYFLSDNRNPVVLDSVGDTTVRFAGFEAPQVFSVDSTTATDAAALPTGKVAAWRCFFKRTGSDGYIIPGAVSNLISWANTSGSTIDATLLIKWPNNGILVAGDTIELYRTLAQDVGTDTGDEEFLSVSYTLSSTDASNKFARIRDTTIDDALGGALYTNADQEGLAKTKQVPPTSTDIASFKGYTFYIATEVANSIYVRVPGLWGNLTSSADIRFGIGQRTKTGCSTTNGSPTALVPDTTGLDVGQIVSYTAFAAGTKVVSIVTNTSVTFDHNATSSHSGATMFFLDVLEVSGQSTTALSLLNVIGSLTGHTLITVDQTLADSTSGSTNLQGANIRLSVPYAYNGTCTIRGTNGQNYSPPIPSMSETAQAGSSDPRTNRLIYSELDQPEACPEGNEVLIGRGVIYRIIPTRDALWCFCSDGLWRLSGEGGVWRVDPVDLTLVLAAPNAVDVLRETIWAYTNRGVVAIDDTVVTEVSKGIIENLVPGATYSATWDTFLTCDQARREVWLTFRTPIISSSTSYVFNTDQNAWSTFSTTDYLSATAFSPTYTALVYGCHESGTPNINKFLTTTSRTTGSVLQFQPLVGDGDPATLKQFIDMTAIFSNVAVTESITPYWDGTANTANDLKLVSDGAGLAMEARVTFGVPRNQAVNVSLRPGLSFDSTQPWIFRGLSIRWVPAAEESLR